MPTAIIITARTALKPDILPVVVFATADSVIGAVIGYFLGVRGGRPALIWLFDEKKITRVDRLFEKYGVYAVGICRIQSHPLQNVRQLVV